MSITKDYTKLVIDLCHTSGTNVHSFKELLDLFTTLRPKRQRWNCRRILVEYATYKTPAEVCNYGNWGCQNATIYTIDLDRAKKRFESNLYARRSYPGTKLSKEQKEAHYKECVHLALDFIIASRKLDSFKYNSPEWRKAMSTYEQLGNRIDEFHATFHPSVITKLLKKHGLAYPFYGTLRVIDKEAFDKWCPPQFHEEYDKYQPYWHNKND